MLIRYDSRSVNFLNEPVSPFTSMNVLFSSWFRWTLIILGVVYVWTHASYFQSPEPADETSSIFRKLGVMESRLISESSGVVVSLVRPNLLWTINDSGQTAELFGVHESGKLLCQVELTVESARNQDWEAISAFKLNDIPHLLVADVGDNSIQRASCQLYFFPETQFEPAEEVKKFTLTANRIDFVYDGGPRNCEAVAVDPLTNEVWLIEKVYYESKQKQAPGIFILPLAEYLSATEPGKPKQGTALRIGEFPIRNVTGMEFSPNGERLVIRNYLSAHLYEKLAGKNWRETVSQSEPISVPMPLQRQGEAIAFTADSKSLIVTSESIKQPIWQIDLETYLKQYQAAKQD